MLLLFSAHKLMFFAFILTGEPEWQPAVSDETIEVHQVLLSEPNLAGLASNQVWGNAIADSSLVLLHAYLNMQLIHEDPAEYAVATKWWNELLDNDPRSAAKAVAELDTQYVVWNVMSWPEDRSSFLTEYRISIITVLYESFFALQLKIGLLEQEINNFVLPDLTPPEGFPFRTDPASIQDPVKREEYRKRFNAIIRQREVKEIFDDHTNTLGELLYGTASNVSVLYRDIDGIELESLVNFICSNGWGPNEFTRKISSSWQEFDDELKKVCDLEQDGQVINGSP